MSKITKAQNNASLIIANIRNKIAHGEKSQFDTINRLLKKSLELTGQEEKHLEILTTAEMISRYAISNSSAIIIYLMSVLFQNLGGNAPKIQSNIDNEYIDKGRLIYHHLSLINSSAYEMNPLHVPLYLKNEKLSFDLYVIILVSEYRRICYIIKDKKSIQLNDYICFALRPLAFDLELGELVVALDKLLLETKEESCLTLVDEINSSSFINQLKRMEISDGVINIENAFDSRIHYITAKPATTDPMLGKYHCSDIVYLLTENRSIAYDLLGWILNQPNLTLLPYSFRDYTSTPYFYNGNAFVALVFTVTDNNGNNLLFIIQSEECKKSTILTSDLSTKQLKQIGFPPEIMNKSFRAMSKKKNKVVKEDNKDRIVCLSYFGGSYAMENGSTVLDLCFLIHSEVGIHFNSAIVNNHKVDLDYRVKNGDIIIVKSALSCTPEMSWLNHSTTKKARKTLRKYLATLNDDMEKKPSDIQSGKELKCTTPKPTLFISYKWVNETEAIYIEKQLSSLYDIVRDNKAMREGDDIIAFMKSIRKQDHAVLIISDDYLKAEACMFELLEVFKDEENDKFKEKIHFLVLDSAKMIFSPIDRTCYIKFWIAKEDEYKEELKKIRHEDLKKYISLIQEYAQTSEIAHNIDKALNYISNHLASTTTRGLIDFIKTKFQSDSIR